MSIKELNSEEDVVLTQKEIHTASREVHIDVVQGDITTREVDAIVNAAHEGLTGGGGGVIESWNFPPCTQESADRIICSFMGGVSNPSELSECKSKHGCWMDRKDAKENQK